MFQIGCEGNNVAHVKVIGYARVDNHRHGILTEGGTEVFHDDTVVERRHFFFAHVNSERVSHQTDIDTAEAALVFNAFCTEVIHQHPGTEPDIEAAESVAVREGIRVRAVVEFTAVTLIRIVLRDTAHAGVCHGEPERAAAEGLRHGEKVMRSIQGKPLGRKIEAILPSTEACRIPDGGRRIIGYCRESTAQPDRTCTGTEFQVRHRIHTRETDR